MGDPDNMAIARTYFAQAIKLNPNSVRSLYGCFLVRFMTGRVIDSVACFTSRKLDMYYKELYGQHPFLHNELNCEYKIRMY